MNKATRARLREIADQLTSITEYVEEVRDEEQDKFDNMPENLQYSYRGEAFENAADALNDAAEALENARERIEEAASV